MLTLKMKLQLALVIRGLGHILFEGQKAGENHKSKENSILFWSYLGLKCP